MASSLVIPGWLSEYDNDVLGGLCRKDDRGFSVLHLYLLTPVSVETTFPKLQDFAQKWKAILEEYYALEDPTDLGPLYASLNEESNKLRIVDCESSIGKGETLYEEELTLEEFAECARLFLLSRRT